MDRTPKTEVSLSGKDIELLRWALYRDFSSLRDHFYQKLSDAESTEISMKLMEENLAMDERLRRISQAVGITHPSKDFHDGAARDRSEWYVKILTGNFDN